MLDEEKVSRLAFLLGILAQPTRLKILYLLREGERCICEVNPLVEGDPSVISRHMAKMRDAGVLESRRQGVAVFYRINDPRIFGILDEMDALERDNGPIGLRAELDEN